MQRLWHGDDEGSWLLHASEHGHLVAVQQRRWQHGDELEVQVGLLVHELRQGALQHFLERLRLLRGNAVPDLRSALVHVVHRVKIVVLVVPEEQTEKEKNRRKGVSLGAWQPLCAPPQPIALRLYLFMTDQANVANSIPMYSQG